MICADCRRFGPVIRSPGKVLLCLDCRNKPQRKVGTIQIHAVRATDNDYLRAHQGRLAAS